MDLLSALAESDSLHQAFHTKEGAVVQLTDENFVRALKQFAPQSCIGQSDDNILKVFHCVDCDGDGLVTWDDLCSYTLDTAMQRLDVRPAERIRKYSFSRTYSRDDNIIRLWYLSAADRLAVSSKHHPLDILDVATFVMHHRLSLPPTVVPLTVELQPTTMSLSAFCSDLRLRTWIFLEHGAHLASTLLCESRISRLRCAARAFPTSMFASDRSGFIRVYEMGRQQLTAAGNNDPHISIEIALHNADAGGIADFCFVKPQENLIISSGFDHQLILTEIKAEGIKHSVIGNPSCVLKRIEYCTGFHCIIAAGVDDSVSLWVTHQSHSPMMRLSDNSRPHSGEIVGLDYLKGTPQVVTVDGRGLVKVWDLRNFRCCQSFLIGTNTEVVGEGAGEFSGQTQHIKSHSFINAACFLRSTNEVLCAYARGLIMYEYDRGFNPSLADQFTTICVQFNEYSNNFVTVSGSNISIWNPDEGCLEYVYPKTSKTEMTSFTTDGKGRRLIAGSQDGTVQVRSFHGGGVVVEHKFHTSEVGGLAYSEVHHAIVAAYMDGMLCVKFERDLVGPPIRVKVTSCPILSLAISSRLALIACGVKNGKIYVQDLAHPRANEAEYVHHQPVRCVCFLGNFPVLVSSHVGGELVYWGVRPIIEPEKICVQNVDDFVRTDIDDFAAVGGARSSSTFFSSSSQQLDSMSLKISALAIKFDPISHNLILGDSNGRISVLKQCPLLQAFDLPTCEFPGTTPFRMKSAASQQRGGHRGAKKKSFFPKLTACFKAHDEEVIDISLVPKASIIVSCGDDRRVLLWDLFGRMLGELSMGRLPRDTLSTKSMINGTGAVSSPVSSGGSSHHGDVTDKNRSFALANFVSPTKMRRQSINIMENLAQKVKTLGNFGAAVEKNRNLLLLDAPIGEKCCHGGLLLIETGGVRSVSLPQPLSISPGNDNVVLGEKLSAQTEKEDEPFVLASPQPKEKSQRPSFPMLHVGDVSSEDEHPCSPEKVDGEKKDGGGGGGLPQVNPTSILSPSIRDNVFSQDPVDRSRVKHQKKVRRVPLNNRVRKNSATLQGQSQTVLVSSNGEELDANFVRQNNDKHLSTLLNFTSDEVLAELVQPPCILPICARIEPLDQGGSVARDGSPRPGIEESAPDQDLPAPSTNSECGKSTDGLRKDRKEGAGTLVVASTAATVCATATNLNDPRPFENSVRVLKDVQAKELSAYKEQQLSKKVSSAHPQQRFPRPPSHNPLPTLNTVAITNTAALLINIPTIPRPPTVPTSARMGSAQSARLHQVASPRAIVETVGIHQRYAPRFESANNTLAHVCRGTPPMGRRSTSLESRNPQRLDRRQEKIETLSATLHRCLSWTSAEPLSARPSTAGQPVELPSRLWRERLAVSAVKMLQEAPTEENF